MKVCKFGGSSLADAGQLTKVIDIVLADPQRRIVVVSAPGKRNKADTKVTDLLIALAQKAREGDRGGPQGAPRPSSARRRRRRRLHGPPEGGGRGQQREARGRRVPEARQEGALRLPEGHGHDPRGRGRPRHAPSRFVQASRARVLRLRGHRRVSGLLRLPHGRLRGHVPARRQRHHGLHPRGGGARRCVRELHRRGQRLPRRPPHRARGEGRHRHHDLPRDARTLLRRFRRVQRRGDLPRRAGAHPDQRAQHEPPWRAGHDDRADAPRDAGHRDRHRLRGRLHEHHHRQVPTSSSTSI